MDKFAFYRKWYDNIKELPVDERLELYDAIILYAFERKIGEFCSSLAKMAFQFIKQEIDNDTLRQAEISAKRRNAGKQGGAPKNNRNALRNKEREEQAEPISAPTLQVNLFGDVEPVERQEKLPKPKKPSKHKYAEYVLLTDIEYQKLVDTYGEEGAQWMITKLDNYKAARGMTYKSDYRAILNWVTKEYEEQKRYGIRRVNTIEVSATSAEEYKGPF